MTKVKRAVTFSPLPVLLMFVLVQPTLQRAQEKGRDNAALKQFAGAWKGVCADGKEFVVLSLHLSRSDIVGTISLANMKGQDGQCDAVVNPPSPDHAMKISDAQLKGNALAFRGSQRAAFEMTVVGTESARLKFVDTPVENNPWQLTRAK